MSARELRLPSGGLCVLHDPPYWKRPTSQFRKRIAYAAAHVVCDPLAGNDPSTSVALDWDTTLGYRAHLWSYGFAIAEAMDTAQRGMGLDWPAAQELVRLSARDAQACGGRIASGAGTDHLPPGPATLDDVIEAYVSQCAFIESTGSRVILMASRALASVAKHADDYARVYAHVLAQVVHPVILHWLGPQFDPQLAGYWGSCETDVAMQHCLRIIAENHSKVEGIKISLLDPEQEVRMRRLLPNGVRMFTGDDFHYDRLIAGDERGYSDALLGIFDAIAPAASEALQHLDDERLDDFHRVLAPTIALSRHIFEAPTYSYKTGIVFLAWLNGHQKHFRMVGGKESARSVLHLARIVELANDAGLLCDPDLAAARARLVFAQAGLE